MDNLSGVSDRIRASVSEGRIVDLAVSADWRRHWTIDQLGKELVVLANRAWQLKAEEELHRPLDIPASDPRTEAALPRKYSVLELSAIQEEVSAIINRARARLAQFDPNALEPPVQDMEVFQSPDRRVTFKHQGDLVSSIELNQQFFDQAATQTVNETLNKAFSAFYSDLDLHAKQEHMPLDPQVMADKKNIERVYEELGMKEYL